MQAVPALPESTRLKLWLGLFLAAGGVSAIVNRGGALSWLTLLALLLPALMIWITEGAAARARSVAYDVYLPLFVVSGFLTAFYAVIVTIALRWDRAQLPGMGENGLGTLFLIMAGLGYGYFNSSRCRFRSPWFKAAFLALVVVGLVLTKSRGAWLGFGIMLVLMGAFKREWRGTLALMLAGAFVLLWWNPPFRSRLLSMVSLEQNWDRLHIWELAVDMIQASPWFGVGPGHFGEVFASMTPTTIGAATAHNLILTLGAEYGIPALIAMLLLLAEILRVQFRLALSGDPLWISVLATTAGVLGHQMVDHTLFSVKIQVIFWALAGWSLAAYREQGLAKTQLPAEELGTRPAV